MNKILFLLSFMIVASAANADVVKTEVHKAQFKFLDMATALQAHETHPRQKAVIQDGELAPLTFGTGQHPWCIFESYPLTGEGTLTFTDEVIPTTPITLAVLVDQYGNTIVTCRTDQGNFRADVLAKALGSVLQIDLAN